jgi:transcriptional regulator with XRE-family HTH domain
MFRQFAALLPKPELLFDAHPYELAWLLEEVWRFRIDVAPTPSAPGKSLGDPDRRSNLDPRPPYDLQDGPPLKAELRPIFVVRTDPVEIRRFRWDHLIYAYMVENTRIAEIFRRVVHEYAHGEKLGSPTDDAQAWLRNTEELFFKDGAPFFIGSVQSHLRPDIRANRRNAYQRMFAMELNHGADDGRPYPYTKAEAANNDFVATFEEFLREVWVGMTYVTASAASNPTDPSKIATLASKLKNMLLSRRQAGNLSREEYSAVAAMAWFHLALEFKNNNDQSPIVKALRAEANGTEQRLFKIAERVGLPAHGLAKHFFDIADAISRILIQIEFGDYDSAEAVPALYTPATGGNTPETAMRTIITHWTAITGRDVKASKVRPN